jgi:hypothetical protein
MLRQPLEGRVIPPLLILASLASQPPSTVCTFEREKGLPPEGDRVHLLRK